MEHVYGILLDQKFLYWSFVNTKWYEGPRCALADARPALCLSSHKTHLLFRVFVVVLSLITSRWVAAAVAGSARSDVFFTAS